MILSLYTAVARRNKHARLEGIRVYGLLTNLNFFHFYSYDQSQRKFAFDETLRASFRSDREMFMMDMIHGMCYPIWLQVSES